MCYVKYVLDLFSNCAAGQNNSVSVCVTCSITMIQFKSHVFKHDNLLHHTLQGHIYIKPYPHFLDFCDLFMLRIS